MTSDVEKKPASPRQDIVAKYDLNAPNLLRAAPVALGEDATQYDLLLKAEIEQWRPQRPYDWVLVQQLVVDEWRLLQFPAVSALLLDAAVANTVHEQLAAAEALKMPAPKDRHGQNTADKVIGAQLWLSLRQKAFAAVLGDSAAIALVEEKLGPGQLKVTPETASHLERTFRTQLQADRVIAATLTRCANVYRELERRALKRDEDALSALAQRALQQEERTEYPSLSDLIKSRNKPAAPATDAGPSDVGAAAPDKASAAPTSAPQTDQCSAPHYVMPRQSFSDMVKSTLSGAVSTKDWIVSDVSAASAKEATASGVCAAASEDASAAPTTAADPPSVHAPDPLPSEVPSPRTEEISAPQTDEASAPLTEEISAPPTDEVTK
jgi:hypothetical protein